MPDPEDVVIEWSEIQAAFASLVEKSGKSARRVAREIGIKHPTVLKLVDGTTNAPQIETARKIMLWMKREADRQRGGNNVELDSTTRNAGESTAEQELLEYFLEHHEQMATFMTLQAREAPTAEDRRKIYFWGLNALKRAHVELGEPIPPVLFELERRLMEPERE